jgi:rhodanese-related sulfurtransferase
MATQIAPAAVKDLVNPLLLDVRTPGEFRAASIPGAVLHPLDRLDAAEVRRLRGEGRLCVLICQGGTRASKAAAQLEAAGLGDMLVMEGGMNAWQAAGLPVERSQGVISLERQVRIAAGLLVLLGVGLGTWVHPGFYGLSAFVGAGLVFAGVTDFCGMGLLLARMPWNR